MVKLLEKSNSGDGVRSVVDGRQEMIAADEQCLVGSHRDGPTLVGHQPRALASPQVHTLEAPAAVPHNQRVLRIRQKRGGVK